MFILPFYMAAILKNGGHLQFNCSLFIFSQYRLQSQALNAEYSFYDICDYSFINDNKQVLVILGAWLICRLPWFWTLWRPINMSKNIAFFITFPTIPKNLNHLWGATESHFRAIFAFIQVYYNPYPVISYNIIVPQSDMAIWSYLLHGILLL